MIKSTNQDSLETILKTIQEGGLDAYMLYRITHSSMMFYINLYIQLKDPELWKEIKKVYYPTFFEKLKRKIFNRNSHKVTVQKNDDGSVRIVTVKRNSKK